MYTPSFHPESPALATTVAAVAWSVYQDTPRLRRLHQDFPCLSPYRDALDDVRLLAVTL